MTLLLSSLAGCKTAGEPPPPTAPGAPGAPPGAVAGTGYGEAACARPEDHCLEPGEVLVADAPFESGWVRAELATAAGAPDASGETPYTMAADGATVTKRYAFPTHRAAGDEVVVGALVAALDVADDEGVYRAPRTRAEATGRWFVSRIVSVDPVDQGHVIVSGGYLVATDALRRVDGDTSPTLATSSEEDHWFVKPEHWFFGGSDLPDGGYVTCYLAYAIEEPSPRTRGEGRFLLTASGEERWSSHAWRTRVATAADLQPGTRVIAFDVAGSDGVYRPPASRVEAVSGRWFLAEVTDTAEAYKGVVTLAGQYRTAVEGLRVVVK